MTRRRPTGLGLLVLAAVLAGLGLLQAATPDRPATLQQRVDAVAATIRCPTCQGLSVQDSPSVLAEGSRQIVEQQLREGRTPDQVRQYFVDRYGASALLSPDAAGPGLLAWLVPAAVLPLVAAVGWRRLRRPAHTVGAAGAVAGEAATVLASYRDGALHPDASAAGEQLREALLARLALDEDGLDDPQLRGMADRRVVVAGRRYTARRESVPSPRSSSSRGQLLPRGVLTGIAVVALLGAAGGALAVGVRDRGAGDLPTGDLPGASAGTTPGLGELVAATQRRPDDPQAWAALGQAYDAAQRWAPALKAYDRALSLQPDDGVVLLRASLLVRAGSPTEALPVLEQLVQRQPEDAQALLVLGLAQRAVGAPEAPATLRRFLRQAPDTPPAEMVRQLLADQ